jgi:Family of unknown function (DUF6521)
VIAWAKRSREERALLNPGFCANLLWHAAQGSERSAHRALSFEESFLVLPFVLHRATRQELPRSTRTSLAVWLDENPLARGRVTSRARFLVPYTKEALLFGGLHSFLHIDAGTVRADNGWKATVNKVAKESSEEVRDCAKRADFVGNWFAGAGNSATVLALVGVRA